MALQAASARAGSISGRVLSEAGLPIVFASVLLQNATDSTLVTSAITGREGEYLITPVPDGSYRLRVMLLGYETWSVPVTVSGASATVPDITLRQNEQSLQQVTVTTQKPFIEVHPDKLVVNVDNSIVSAGSNALEVLSQSPGVTVDQNDNVSLKGRQGVNIMIDGRRVPVSATDLANMLKAMPSSAIDKIEIIANPSAKYDAAGTAGIINIRTKREKGMGFNGSVTGSYGQGRYQKENGGFNLDFRQKKWNVYANCNTNYRIGFSHVNWTRQYYQGPDYKGAYVQDNYSVLYFHTNTVAVGADYNMNARTSMGVAVNGENFYLGTKGYYYANVVDSFNRLTSVFATSNTSGGNWNNYAPNAHFRHTFDSMGRELTADVDYARYWNRNHQDFTTRYFLPDGTEYQAPYVLHGNINGITQIQSVKADYVNPMKDNARFETGIKASYVTADNKPDFFDRSNGGDVWDAGKSDHYIYHENINAVYINGAKDWAHWSAQCGLRTEQTVVSGRELITGESLQKNYVQLFPSLALQNHLNKENDLGITVSRRIERPGYEDLNPYTFYVDPSTQKTGNPLLRPALTYAAELTHVYRQRLITTFSASITDDVITEVIKPSTAQEHVTIQTKDNLATMKYIGISGSYTLPLRKWWTNITNFNAFYAYYEGNLSNTNLSAGKPTFDINSSNKFTLPANWSAELTVIYQAAQVYGFLNLTPISMFNVGIQKNLPKQRLNIKLNARDIFWHGNESGSSYFTGYVEHFTARHDTRQAALSLTYRFGKNTVAPVRRHNGGAEDEKKRASDKAAG